jgi:hypothetical protein
MQDDNVAFGADNMISAVQDIMATPDIVKFMTPRQMLAIYGDLAAAGGALRAYRDINGMTERRVPARHPDLTKATAQLRLSAATLALPLVGAGAGTATATTGASIATVVARFVPMLALAMFFNALDDTPEKYKEYGYKVAQAQAALESAVTSLTQDFTDLQRFSSMAMTANEAANATAKQLVDALLEAIRSGNEAVIKMIIAALGARFAKCFSFLIDISTLAEELKILRRTPVVRIPGGGVVTGRGLVGTGIGIVEKISAIRARLSEAVDKFNACVEANYPKTK